MLYLRKQKTQKLTDRLQDSTCEHKIDENGGEKFQGKKMWCKMIVVSCCHSPKSAKGTYVSPIDTKQHDQSGEEATKTVLDLALDTDLDEDADADADADTEADADDAAETDDAEADAAAPLFEVALFLRENHARREQQRQSVLSLCNQLDVRLHSLRKNP